ADGQTEAVTAWPTPQAKNQVRSVLGTAGYGKTPGCNYHGSAGPGTDLADRKLMEMVS
ncbi:unnamed protein product, partial [Staurois parvus]